ncbi:MAG: sugar ABC transporter ATP-binding protein [Planctomycetes bacterium]|nr:sugar ABC transporter ATP-binding protein [Planctomycetota bacterium]
MTLLALSGVTKTFPGVRALDGVSFDVAAGEVHALVGENGAGKSTLIKVLGGAYVPDAGSVLLDGESLPSGDTLGVARRGVRIIYQELALVPELTAAENVFLGRELRVRRLGVGVWLDRRGMRDAAQRVLDDLGAGVDAGAKVTTLSVAERQMVEIARALQGDVRLLVLDEPTSSLPSADAARLLDIVRGLAKRGIGIVYISHRLEEVFAIADRITVLRDGRVTGSAPTSQLDRRSLVRLMVGRDIADEFPRRTEAPGDVVLDVRGLAAPGRLRGVDLTVRRGEIVGLTGLVGSGRTSVGLALYGAIPSTGSMHVDGSTFAPRSPSEALAAGVAYVTEDRKASGVFPVLDVGANVTITSLPMFARAGWIDARRAHAAATAAAAEFDVRSAGLGQAAGTLSGGNQQKVLLARTLLEERKVLVLDEPTRGVDVGAKTEIYALIDRLTRRGLGILFISSELPELIGMADRIVVMQGGRTVGELARGAATEERIMELATSEVAA